MDCPKCGKHYKKRVATFNKHVAGCIGLPVKKIAAESKPVDKFYEKIANVNDLSDDEQNIDNEFGLFDKIFDSGKKKDKKKSNPDEETDAYNYKPAPVGYLENMEFDFLRSIAKNIESNYECMNDYEKTLTGKKEMYLQMLAETNKQIPVAGMVRNNPVVVLGFNLAVDGYMSFDYGLYTQKKKEQRERADENERLSANLE